jgi:creatinine amidohydrolase/Fe(II)-dependent formamide hydrolase-like protein
LTKIRFLTAVILSAAIVTPAFAQGPRVHSPTHHARFHNHQTVRAEDGAALTADERRNLENYGFSGKDPSRVGGEDADLNGVSGN